MEIKIIEKYQVYSLNIAQIFYLYLTFAFDFSEPYRCENADTSFHTPTSASTGTPECHCAESKYTCNDAAKYQSVPWMKMNTTDKLQDLNGHDIQDYLLMTRSEFREKR